MNEGPTLLEPIDSTDGIFLGKGPDALDAVEAVVSGLADEETVTGVPWPKLVFNAYL